ncbi:MAG: glycosyltransferase family 39 protein [Thermoguttaceae bacterium]|nr:glycosyltransferase family 39 protein [Thermoguttaceae bacterium]MDW8079907.1 glycosyltransferase family 39 protein [Thermoguttaceae bacterium]
MKPTNVAEMAILFVIAAFVFLPYLGAARLWDRDEPRNAGCAREMLERGDWVVPTFNGQLRAHKPVLLYWVIMAAYSVFGISEFSARIGSALVATGTLLVTYWVGQRLLPGRSGLWAAASLATMVLFAVSSRSATPDALLVFFSTLGLAAFMLGHFSLSLQEARQIGQAVGDPAQLPSGEPGSGEKHVPLPWKYAFLMYTAWGMAVLAKGPVGFALPALVVFVYLCWEKSIGPKLSPVDRSPSLSTRKNILVYFPNRWSPKILWQVASDMRLVPGTLLALTVATPWYTAVTIATGGEFAQEFFLRHHLARALTPMEGHGGSILFYPFALLVGTFPWSVLAIPCLLVWFRKAKEDRHCLNISVFLLGWVIVYMLIFSLAQTKLPSYLLPSYPAAALLVGVCLEELTKTRTVSLRHWAWAALGVLGTIGLAIAIALPLAARRFLPGQEWAGVIGVVLITGALLGLYYLRRQQERLFIHALVTTACVFTILTVGLLPARASRHRWVEPMLESFRGTFLPVGAIEFCEPSWVFYFGRAIPMLSAQDQQEIASILRQGIIILRDETYAEVKDKLPPHQIVAVGPRFLRRDNLVLLAPPASSQNGSQLASLKGQTTEPEKRR